MECEKCFDHFSSCVLEEIPGVVHSLKLSASLDMKNRPRVQKKDHFLELPPNQ